MAWEIQWTERALTDASKLDPPVAKRVIEKLDQAATDPARYFQRLTGTDDRKLRVGEYRVIGALATERGVIIVKRVAHRSTVYRP